MRSFFSACAFSLVPAFSFENAVTKTRSRVSTGDEWPGGSAVFQITFLLGPNSSGSPVDAETPLPFGPRNCVHSSALALVQANDRINNARVVSIILEANIRECLFFRGIRMV